MVYFTGVKQNIGSHNVRPMKNRVEKKYDVLFRYLVVVFREGYSKLDFEDVC